MHRTEIALGMAGGILLFFTVQGYDIMPVIFFIALIGGFILLAKARPGHKSFAAPVNNTQSGVLINFDDIGGQEIAKNELREALEFIKDIKRLNQLGIRPLKGILLSGPPGTGKTLLAKAAAQFTDSAFLSAGGSEFVEMYVGVGAQRIRQLFQQARQQARAAKKESAVIFIDEIEVLGGKRGQANSNLEYDQTLNELLVQLDGLTNSDDIRILVVAATNRIDILDPALLRPGRFDRQVRVDLPDKNGRLHILKLHTRNKPLAGEVDLETIAADTFGFSGAHLESVANEAAIMALRENRTELSDIHFRNAIEKVIMGEKLDRLPNNSEKKRIAVHEAGHAILSELSQPGSVASVNIASRSNALGYVRQTQAEDIYLYPSDYLKEKIAVALAGAVAEEITFGNRSTGAASDFKAAVGYTKQMIYGGMSKLGIVSPDDLPQELLHQTITAILREIELTVGQTLNRRKNLLAAFSRLLLEKECVSGSEFRRLLAQASAPLP
ncbi:AAA family ATPase|uniref:Vesicle-fusing ATPase n=1 Tax=Dendrosporobacter quercicolus TaxID=146817 RepID=A0A1G9N823_9FIRM|nr:AAA family ATPase [Dendrosporobacter quercicolus]NSL47244.1 AAA family ATPase [Dendrosporobacter quercicolus DSM 1736]SDL82005.1 vesicle-fusing ATPase [Dendrosporobacter quercicolus]